MIRTMTGILACLLVGLLLVQARIGAEENVLTQEERLLPRSVRTGNRAGRNKRGRRPAKDEFAVTPKNAAAVVQDEEEEDEEITDAFIPGGGPHGMMMARMINMCATSKEEVMCSEPKRECVKDSTGPECPDGLKCFENVCRIKPPTFTGDGPGPQMSNGPPGGGPPK
jgi:hypothetical protein